MGECHGSNTRRALSSGEYRNGATAAGASRGQPGSGVGMSLSALESSLLWLGIEDYTGLWDAGYEVSAVFSDLPTSGERNTAKTLLSDLARRDLIRLYRCVGTLASGQISDIALEMLDSVLADDQLWQPPQTPFAESVWYATTEAGESLYWASR